MLDIVSRTRVLLLIGVCYTEKHDGLTIFSVGYGPKPELALPRNDEIVASWSCHGRVTLHTIKHSFSRWRHVHGRTNCRLPKTRPFHLQRKRIDRGSATLSQ